VNKRCKEREPVACSLFLSPRVETMSMMWNIKPLILILLIRGPGQGKSA